MKEILFIDPVFKSMVWGGNRLKTEFGYDIPDEHTGECWAISAHPNGDCTIKNGTFKGKSLSWLWENKRELFGNRTEERFPLLVKIIDAKEDLSIQVHPDDKYAYENENGSFGKTECWYILDCKENGEIVIGHNAKDKEELKQMIEHKKWDELIRVCPIKKGDFFQITPGTVHAIKGGTMLLETQQSSDVTYRLYDYDRLDNGKPRQLHIKQSIDVINCPHMDAQTGGKIIKDKRWEIRELISCPYYTVKKIDLWGELKLAQDKDFMNVSIIEGDGEIDGIKVSKGDHFILPHGYGEFKLKGDMELIISYI
ncbi:mannose-6-phosphate isomerase type 1 [Herbinix hemicellulosilytica]|uniref:mannose-6-phosphate isomerase n=1 Tax=Herbinix hemicellulosilytica TaxID=1564487 RepID=A0A0H5SI06_HERHM|nr:mannose-6-phosphate isomerase, class I [Herbinix hemicellulosilytica]RBP56451.1 mannose-6-phosphate isomerase type 1 [Herbinix hemicellulosilytica]CRZ35127.1 putative mannose-6-phosphate isomerase YvyI [Herbinix hemicellulosilytica]